MGKALNVDLSGRVAVVTGANTGIGREVASGLARLGATVVMACRSAERGQVARDALAAETGNPRIELMTVDLSSQASIRRFAQAFGERYDRLHALVNNAGLWAGDRELSADGIEMTWATNVLGYYLMIVTLLDRLRAGAPARVVNVASDLARDLDLGDVQFERRAFGGMTAYAQSKQANRMLTWALAKRLQGTGVTANAVHPGFVHTELFRHQGGLVGGTVSQGARFFGRKPEKGAETVTWAAAAPELEGISGKFFADLHEKPCPFREPATVEALWRLCGEMTQAPL